MRNALFILAFAWTLVLASAAPLPVPGQSAGTPTAQYVLYQAPSSAKMGVALFGFQPYTTYTVSYSSTPGVVIGNGAWFTATTNSSGDWSNESQSGYTIGLLQPEFTIPSHGWILVTRPITYSNLIFTEMAFAAPYNISTGASSPSSNKTYIIATTTQAYNQNYTYTLSQLVTNFHETWTACPTGPGYPACGNLTSFSSITFTGNTTDNYYVLMPGGAIFDVGGCNGAGGSTLGTCAFNWDNLPQSGTITVLNGLGGTAGVFQYDGNTTTEVTYTPPQPYDFNFPTLLSGIGNAISNLVQAIARALGV